MASIYFIVLKRFILFILLQGLLFNSFDLFGSFDPHIALVFILTFPIKINKINFMIISFCFGLCLDLFSNSLGLNTAAYLTAAFSRSYILSFIFGSFFDPLGLKLIKNYISESSFSQKLLYLLSIILAHHFVLFFLEAFSFKFITLIIYKTLASSLLSLIFCTTIIYIMIKNEK